MHLKCNIVNMDHVPMWSPLTRFVNSRLSMFLFTGLIGISRTAMFAVTKKYLALIRSDWIESLHQQPSLTPSQLRSPLPLSERYIPHRNSKDTSLLMHSRGAIFHSLAFFKFQSLLLGYPYNSSLPIICHQRLAVLHS